MTGASLFQLLIIHHKGGCAVCGCTHNDSQHNDQRKRCAALTLLILLCSLFCILRTLLGYNTISEQAQAKTQKHHNFRCPLGTAYPRRGGKRVDTCGFYPLDARFPLFLSPAQTRDRRPLREGERQRIFSSAGAHSVRPFLYLYAMPDTVLLHISAALRRCSTAVPHNSFACCYRRHLRIKSVVIVILQGGVPSPRPTVKYKLISTN